MVRTVIAAALVAAASAGVLNQRQDSSSSEPEYFQTFPQIYAGPTKTGSAPFLAQVSALFLLKQHET